MTDLDTIEAVALAATENVRDDGYRITAPDGTVIVEYKHSPHPNAEADGALFGHAREYVLTLVAAVREREAECERLKMERRAACVEVGRLRANHGTALTHVDDMKSHLASLRASVLAYIEASDECESSSVDAVSFSRLRRAECRDAIDSLLSTEP